MKGLLNAKGFTLIEVLAAIVIFSVTLLLFNAYFVNSFSHSKKQDTKMVAINVARQIAEQWKNGEGASSLPTPSGETFNYEHVKDLISEGNVEYSLSPTSINGTSYLPKVTLKEIPAGSEDNPLILIIVTVYQENSETSKPLATLYTSMANPNKGG
ncbi:prepilin-type N-terminal cleavage/methylation domain-containing protein [Aneurinibacillus sp. BA2021]|nr:prepilin-type N-terminal cleavage/methylation domain-containing protein [Aneurinibacillus sp. BA2021]